MKNNAITLFSIGFLTMNAAFSQTQKKTYYDYQKTKIEEIYYVNSQEQKSGKYIKYDERGIKAVEVTYLNGALQGPGKEYYLPWSGTPADARLKITGQYSNSEKDGIWITYDYIVDGKPFKTDEELKAGVQTKQKEEHYKLGKLIREVTYYPNGKLQKDYYLQNGTIKSYFEDGKPNIIGTMKNETFDSQYASYYSNGKPNILCTLKNGTFDGDFISYNSNGIIVFKGKYKEGTKLGEWILARDGGGYFPETGKEDETQYTRKVTFKEDGKVDETKPSVSHYMDGTLRDSCFISEIGDNGYEVYAPGDFLYYYPNGKLSMQGKLKERCSPRSVDAKYKTGTWKYYKEDGSFDEEIKH